MLRLPVLLSGLMTMALFTAPICHAEGAYPINYPEDSKIPDGRSLKSVVFSSPSDGVQSLAIGQDVDKLLYHNVTDKCFSAVIGETVSVSFDWVGTWMHGYVYLDRGNDGEYSWVLGENSAIPEGSDVMAFSSYAGYNSIGEQASGNCGVNPPSFTIPADLTPGFYHMRYKIDWNSADPGGNDANGLMHNQSIVANKGAIVDVQVYLHNEERSLSVESAHGMVTAADGTSLDNADFTTGEDFTVKFVADNGYQLSMVTVESGSDKIDSPIEFVSTSLGVRTSMSMPAFLIQDNTYTIPGEYMRGRVVIKAEFEEAGNEPSEGNYESGVSGTKDEAAGITAFTVNAGGKSSTLNFATTQRHFFDETSVLSVQKGVAVTPSVTYTGSASEIKFYIDVTQNGVFSSAGYEMVSTAAAGADMPSFTVNPLIADGIYRCRIEAGDDCVVDFLMNLHNAEEAQVKLNVLNGYAYGASKSVLPASVPFGGSFAVMVEPTLPGFEADELVIRYGQNLKGEQFIHGNRQWSEVTKPIGETVTLDNIQGDILVCANFEETENSEWTYIWGDEFESGEMDKTKWANHPRWSSTWNKNIAINEAVPYVNKFEDGCYKSYAMATPSECASNNPQEMITGCIYSAGKFYMTGGKLEARMRTTRHAGNFPAFWMMPASQPRGWPKDGEIDIMEQIDNENISYHTIHSGWAYKSYGAVSQASPNKGGTASANMDQWHVYTLEWDQDALKWFVDGKLAFTYRNMHFSEGQYTEQVTWPFYKGFYVILNQSVGDGSWAAKYDKTFTYLTEFDYVRAYQRKDALDYYTAATGHVSGIEDVLADVAAEKGSGAVVYYTLQGVRVETENLAQGVYIRKQGKNVTKVMVK